MAVSSTSFCNAFEPAILVDAAPAAASWEKGPRGDEQSSLGIVVTGSGDVGRDSEAGGCALESRDGRPAEGLAATCSS